MDALAKLANAKATVNNRTIIQETIQIPYINKVMNVEEKESWMTLIICYLKQGELLMTKKKQEC